MRWIVISKHSKDRDAENWVARWAAENYLKTECFYPSRKKTEISNRSMHFKTI